MEGVLYTADQDFARLAVGESTELVSPSAVREPNSLVGFKAAAKFVPRYAFAPVELRKASRDLEVDGFFVFLQPSPAFGLDFQGVEENIFHAVERAAVKALLNECFNLGTVDFNGHG
jgi:hypothetical protein